MQVSVMTNGRIALVFRIASGRIQLNRTARPSRSDRDVGGAVKRDLPVTVPQSRSDKRRVVLASFRLLLVICFLCAQALFQVAAAQAPPDDNKPKDDVKKEEPKKEDAKDADAKGQVDDVRRDTPAKAFKPGSTLHIDVDMALVYATVTDPYNRLVTGLDPDNFRIFEDNVEQEVTTFSAEDVPISIGVIFDFSGSMSNKVGKAREAALQFFKTANPQD